MEINTKYEIGQSVTFKLLDNYESGIIENIYINKDNVQYNINCNSNKLGYCHIVLKEEEICVPSIDNFINTVSNEYSNLNNIICRISEKCIGKYKTTVNFTHGKITIEI